MNKVQFLLIWELVQVHSRALQAPGRAMAAAVTRLKVFSTVPFSSHFSVPSIWAVGVNISNLDMLFFSNREGWWLFACWVSIPGSCARGVVHNPCGISFNDRAAVVFAGSCQPRGGHLFFSFSPIWRLLDGVIRAVVILDADVNFHNGVGAFRNRIAHQTGLSQNVKCWRAECPNSKHLCSHHHLQLLFHLTMRSNDTLPIFFKKLILYFVQIC